MQMCQEYSFVSDNVCEAITENWTARLEKLDSVLKRNYPETTYDKCVQLLWNSFDVTYAILLLYSHKCRPPVGVLKSLGFLSLSAYIPTLWSKGLQWSPVEIICMFLCLSISLSLFPVVHVAFCWSFTRIIIARSAFSCRPQGQTPVVAV